MERVRLFTAFSGYDSQCMAFDRIAERHPGFSYELVGWSEIDKYAIQLHNLVYPQWADRNYGDIEQIDWEKTPDFDVFTFSSPCQDFSAAGLQRGGEEGSGTRSSLLWECEKAIRAKMPKYLFFENVKALASRKFIGLFTEWCDRVCSYGYVVRWRILNAKDYGVPQNRERLFAVFIRKDVYRGYKFPEPFALGECLADRIDEEVDEKYYLREENVEGFVINGYGKEGVGTEQD